MGTRSSQLVRRVALGASALALMLSATPPAEAAPRTDTQPPTVTSTAMEQWLPPRDVGIMIWRPTFSYAGTDDTGITGWQAERQYAPGTYAGGPVSEVQPASLVGNGAWTSATSLRGEVAPGGRDCLRVRARDGAGQVSAWSGWRCAYGPLKAADLARPSDSVGSPSPASWDAVVLSTVNRFERSSTSDGRYCARGIRLRVRKGPTAGRVRVFVGSQPVGRVDAKAHRAGWKWVTLRSARSSCGPIRMRALSRATTYVRYGYVLR